MRPRASLLFALALAACSGEDEGTTTPVSVAGGAAGTGAAGASTAGSSGAAATGGSAQGGTGASGDAGASGTAGAPVAGASGKAGTGGAGAAGKAGQGGASGKAGQSGAGQAGQGGAPQPCTTRITYGDDWIHPGHPELFDDAAGAVTWDGACVDDGPNSYAVLSNGWKPYFAGNSACTIALDQRNCPGQPADCATRVTYGDAWLPPPNHPAAFDDVAGRLVSDRVCRSDGADGYVALSNGWQPHFTNKKCGVSLRYTQCGGLYQNPVVSTDCPDPGVWKEGDTYTMACTGGDGGGLYVLRTSKNLVDWKVSGHVFPNGSAPGWAKGNFWAPEVHKVGGHFVAYFSAQGSDGVLAVGAASGPTALGPFKDLGKPLVHDASMGMIDVSEFEDAQGSPYLLWKADGNAVGKPTPIYGQPLAADGMSLTGSRVTLLTNDLGWEGPLIEGPWVIRRGGSYYLFYSANAYYNGTYAVGVARASSPLGPYTKHGAPILTTNAAWVGPGHCSVVVGPSGQDMIVYHAWRAGAVGGGNGRVVLVDGLEWSNGWPSVPAAPSSGSRPLP